MNQELNKKILEIIKGYYPDNKKFISELMRILNTSRESIYRRLRNEIPFSLNEVVTMSTQLGFSIDTLIGQNNNRSFFEFFISKEEKPEDSFIEMMEFHSDNLKVVTEAKDSKIIIVTNQLLFTFLIQFDVISKFIYFKWRHQTQNIPLFYKFSDFMMPVKIKTVLKEHLDISRNLKKLIYIFDSNVVLAILKDIKYYYKRGLISENEIKQIREELFTLIRRLETISQNGQNEYDTKISIYISEISIDTNYSYNEYGIKKSIALYNDTIIPMVIYDEEICKNQERKIRSLLKYSTLISESNELQRANFFILQREYINNILC